MIIYFKNIHAVVQLDQLVLLKAFVENCLVVILHAHVFELYVCSMVIKRSNQSHYLHMGYM